MDIATQTPLMTISDEEFRALRNLIYDRFGINLTDQKRSLLVSRLQKLLRQEKIANFKDYYQHLKSDRSERALSKLIDLISTNYTYFDRENDHFAFFRDIALPQVTQQLKAKNRNDLRVWCAGCSTGEEPYMLLMLMAEFFGSSGSQWDAGILATDISERVLTVARAGEYAEDKISAVPETLRRKYFLNRGSGAFQVQERIRREATFRRFNLMNTSFPFKKPFHIIFCRNVMIYFDQPTREALVGRFHAHTEPGGYLFIGHSETLGREQGLYRYLQPAVYQKGL